jgi:hypothetical protein
MALHRTDALTAQDAPDLAPLRASHEANDVEAELKALFMEMLDAFLRPGEREVNTIGTPHLGPFSQVERAVKSEGLALYRRADESAMRFLFKAWRARNPKRGLHMLKAYLQLLWPNGWTVSQQYQLKTAAYPTNLFNVGEPTRYLTSRVQVGISAGDTTEEEILSAVPAMRSVVPARILLDIILMNPMEQTIAMGCAEFSVTAQRFEGTFV